ncbi:mucin-5B-like [Diadema antillarum]|uniref:mucin-5B-like n=1 Tax=Diadema antillarum TaxID=105358 RepID=UPI003A87198E
MKMGGLTFAIILLAIAGFAGGHVSYRRRPEYSFYKYNGDRAPILNQPGHKRSVRSAMVNQQASSGTLTDIDFGAATQVQSIPYAGYCQAWSQQHYRSFDGKLFNFHGACTYTLVTDCIDFSFHVYVENDLDCQDEKANNTCFRSILVDNGDPTALIYLRPGGVAFYKNEELTLPTKAGGLVLESVANYILATSGLGFTILYDGKEAITIFITSDSLSGSTCGLCGVYDNDPANDFRKPSGALAEDAYSFGLSWKGMDERDPAYCPDVPTVPLRCTQYSTFESEELEAKARYAESECSQLLHGTFTACHQVVDPDPYIVACEQDICACEMVTQEDNQTVGNNCKCAAFSAYTQECSRRGFQVPWRSSTFCPYGCSGDKVYDQCGSACSQKSCGAAIADCETDKTVGCIEGCHCPTGTYSSSSGLCLSIDQCSCTWQGKEYDPGMLVSDGCNECKCVDSKWQCTQNDCGGMCQVSGQGHYHTFDSYDYDFSGTCTYTLVKDCWDTQASYSVSIENVECGMEGASCVKAVTLQYESNSVRLRRGHQVIINGQEATEFPVTAGGIYVNQPTEHQTAAVLANGLTILYDGNDHVVVMADERHINSTCGLCGTYNNNQRDDFYTEAGDIESNSASFANKWSIGSSCADAADESGTDPCDLYSQKSITAEEECYRLYTDDAFAPCRQYIDPEVYYDACRSDVCNCVSGDSCKCQIFAMYASKCAQKGVIISWREHMSGCEMKCEGGLVYSACHSMCATTCNAISTNMVCDETCVEGCACPEGSLMSPTGACVTRENCGCVDPDSGERFSRGDKVAKGCGFCTCDSGDWMCEDLDCPADACGVNEAYVACVSPCVKTCANMHEFEACSAATCYSGCACTESTVWNGTQCVASSSCPCHHGKQSYEEGASIQTDECHTCVCENSKWMCEESNCHGTCTAWGDPHYKTFDGKLFDFQGDCDYVMVTDSVSQASGIAFFHVVIGNIPCGSSGVSCTKSITFTIGTGSNQEKLSLVRGAEVPKSAGSFRISQVGAYVYVHTDYGITLLWDQGTWVQVKLDPSYKGKVGGLCGNFNDLVGDDFLSPAGGLPETSSVDFGDSWKVHDYCPRSSQVTNPCTTSPHRRAWSMRQCSVLKSSLFEDCHNEVSYKSYYTRCVYDACGCDYGGDCECLCTAIAAYAQECNARGVPIKWRSNDLCPYQCDGCREYDPCIPVCNVCGLEDRWDEHGLCPDTCVEGCNCPPGQFYQDGECVEECQRTTPSTTTPYVTTTPPWSVTTEPTTTTPVHTPAFNTCVCNGYGDPHYYDFNGNEFDHQGNCTYILSQDSSDPPVYIVLIHNVECANFPGTTCPKELTIIYGDYIVDLLSTFTTLGVHQIRVNNVLMNAPVDYNKTFRVLASDMYLIYQAPDIGLEVRFVPVGMHYFRVEIPEARFYDSTEGLCGNCGVNGTTCEEDNDCCDWMVPEDRERCGCEDVGTELPCTPDASWCQNLYDRPEFEPCYDTVDPEPIFQNCLYDFCHTDKHPCDSFEFYATVCAEKGICLQWRSDDFCPVNCQPPFEFRQCVCPDEEYATCGEFSADCPTEPISGCFCPVGYTRRNDTCIPCPTPTVPVTKPRTTTPTTTAPPTPSFTPTPYIPPPNDCICTGYGDPHYRDFNGNDFDHQGNCTYVLSEDSSKPPKYTVLITNVECERFPGTTCPKQLTIIYGGYEVVLLSDHTSGGHNRVDIDGEPYTAPVQKYNPTFDIFVDGIFVVYYAPEIRLEVRFVPFDLHYFSVRVAYEIYYNSTEGLCGICGVNETTCEENNDCCEWVPIEERRDCGCGEPVPPCPNPPDVDWCKLLYTRPEFQVCHEVVSPDPFFRNCLYDECFSNETTCDAFEYYAIACARAGVCIDWREEDFCPFHCEEPMEYHECECIPSPHDQCTRFHDDNKECPVERVNGCFCPEGTMLVDDECVPCSTPTESVSTPTTRPATTAPPTPTFTPTAYVPPRNECICTGYGDPHYRDFNGNDFDHQGNCTYVLSEDSSKPPKYTVLITNVECERFPGTTCPKQLTIIYGGHTVVLLSDHTSGGHNRVDIDEDQYTAPVSDFNPTFDIWVDGIFVVYYAPDIRLEVRFVPFDLHYFSVRVAYEIYYNSTEGLCGICGVNETTCEENNDCCEWVPIKERRDCGCGEPVPRCPNPPNVDWCKLLYTLPEFQVCHEVVSPDPFFKNCLYDECFSNETTCDAFEYYAIACARAGVCIDWREEDFCL